MTEKEFLKAFIRYGDIVGIDPYEDVEPEDTEITNDKIIDEFLEEHHKEYYEVEFVRIGCELDDLGIVQHTKACESDCLYKDK